MILPGSKTCLDCGWLLTVAALIGAGLAVAAILIIVYGHWARGDEWKVALLILFGSFSSAAGAGLGFYAAAELRYSVAWLPVGLNVVAFVGVSFLWRMF